MGTALFIVVSWGVPLWLVVRCWSRYAEISDFRGAERGQMLAGLILVSASTAMWIFVVALSGLQDESSLIKSVAVNVSPSPIGVLNLMLCIVAIVIAQTGKRADRQSSHLRRLLTICSGLFIPFWAVVTLAVH